ncbi:unnamed protein product [Didymodactylos carnosus]|uniref:C2H2-type domain-containing protein n=1 Tax=Didymodactylos carnosus TaxID=1234261 RepID=A0A813PN60_9BILA|nr:unnamed protein product [Didymodactylos carnosus]CAF0760218.1 unnamed protein product [Didymodactylos carnosus]CAF3536958.1 unnamed protein product [Didymodactylos carnosus]CAF3539955.1 unnamed protein product [Didymodactylos carnosus]
MKSPSQHSSDDSSQHGDECSETALSLVKPSTTTLSINENEQQVKGVRRRKPLRPWSLSARVEKPNTVNSVESMNEDDSQMTQNGNHQEAEENENGNEPITDEINDSNGSEQQSSNDHDDNSNISHRKYSETDDGHVRKLTKLEWPKQLSSLDEQMKLFQLDPVKNLVYCVRCGLDALQDNLLEHISVHYPYNFFCDSSSGLDEHVLTHPQTSKPPNTVNSNSGMRNNPTPSVATVGTTNGNTSTFNQRDSNEDGKSTTPPRSKVYRCRQCIFVSTVKEEFWAHHRAHIRPDKVLECPSCPFVTEYKHHLEYHLRNHLGSKPFKCSKCDYACVNLSMLRSHMKSHFRHLLFKCRNCSFETKQYQALQVHLETEGHEPHLDSSVEEFLKEYGAGTNTTIPTAPPQQQEKIHSQKTINNNGITTRNGNNKRQRSDVSSSNKSISPPLMSVSPPLQQSTTPHISGTLAATVAAAASYVTANNFINTQQSQRLAWNQKQQINPFNSLITSPVSSPLEAAASLLSKRESLSASATSPTSILEQQQQQPPTIDTDLLLQMTQARGNSTSLLCTLCDYVASNKQSLGIHLFEHARKNELLNRSLTDDTTSKLLELFNGKFAFGSSPNSFSQQQLSTFVSETYQNVLSQQFQQQMSAAYDSFIDNNNNNTTSLFSLLNGASATSLTTSSRLSTETLTNGIKSEPIDVKIKSELKRPLTTSISKCIRKRKGRAFKILKTEQDSTTAISDNDEDEEDEEQEDDNEMSNDATDLKAANNDLLQRLNHDQQQDTNDPQKLLRLQDQETQVDEKQIEKLFECSHCEILFRDFALYCIHKLLHYSQSNPFKCAQCGEQKANKVEFFIHVAQTAHELT